MTELKILKARSAVLLLALVGLALEALRCRLLNTFKVVHRAAATIAPPTAGKAVE